MDTTTPKPRPLEPRQALLIAITAVEGGGFECALHCSEAAETNALLMTFVEPLKEATKVILEQGKRNPYANLDLSPRVQAMLDAALAEAVKEFRREQDAMQKAAVN